MVMKSELRADVDFGGPTIAVVGQWREGEHGRVPAAYLDAVSAAGSRPRLVSTFPAAPGDELPPGAAVELDEADDSVLDGACGLVLPGGGDIDPDFYGRPRHPQTHNVNHRRDRFELHLIDRALRDDLPVFAICHGMQLLNVHLGGTLRQHLPDHETGVDHDRGRPRPEPAHRLRVKEGALLARCFGTTHLNVNSHHHQGIDDVAGILDEVAWAEDGVLEAVESRVHSWVVGVQWHPETMAATDPRQRSLFECFVAATEAYAPSRRAAATV